jgi:hypothetical protein
MDKTGKPESLSRTDIGQLDYHPTS